MTEGVPLPTLLSQVLVAFTIEFDNESEQQIRASGSPRRFLVSLAMWANLMRVVGDDGVAIRRLPELIGVPGTPVTTGWIHSTLNGLHRWGYITIERDPSDSRAKPPRADLIVRATPVGRNAQDIWRPLARVIEERWQPRFGHDEIAALREALRAVVGAVDVELPHALPIIGADMRVSIPNLADGVPFARAPHDTSRDTQSDLSVLLSRALLLFTVDFEHESKLSFAISANPLRVITDDGVRVRDLPALTGVSKEAISWSVGLLERRGYVTVGTDAAGGRAKVVVLTPRGQKAQAAYRTRVAAIEGQWRERFGADTIDALRASLERLLHVTDGENPRMSEGLAAPPGGWRATSPYAKQAAALVRDPAGALPHHPMVLHRGGWPDGS